MDIVDNIKSLCAKNGTTIPKLEKALGFGNGTIYNWAKSSPSIDKLQKVAMHFKVPIDELIGWGNIYDIGWTLKEEREKQAIALEELAFKLNISTESMAEIEDDIIPLSSEQLDLACDLFGMTSQEFLIKYEMYDEAIPDYFRGDADAYLKFKAAEAEDAMKEGAERFKAEEHDIQTIAAHHDGEEWTEEELKQIEEFKEFVRSRRKQKGE